MKKKAPPRTKKTGAKKKTQPNAEQSRVSGPRTGRNLQRTGDQSGTGY